MSYGAGWFGDKWSALGVVEFQNGNTKGEQKFEGDSFDDVVSKMKLFIETDLK